MPGDHAESAEPVAAFRGALIRAGLLVPAEADGLFGFSSTFEAVIDGVSRLVGGLFADRAVEALRFPPIMTRGALRTSRYLEGFPHLAGSIHCFCGDTGEHRQMLACIGEGGDESVFQKPSEFVLTPAACYPVYPLVACRGPVPAEGLLMDISSYCFRHEPSTDPARLQMFRQREHVFFGTPRQTAGFQEQWMERTFALLDLLSLGGAADPASDAFFGRAGEMLGNAQKSERLKLEVLVAISDPAVPHACGSVNHHKTHFSSAFGIFDEAGAMVHTSCAGFGLERLTLALLRRHGLLPRLWPMEVRELLQLGA